MTENFIVVRDGVIIKVYQTSESEKGIQKALINRSIEPEKVAILKKSDDFQYSVGDLLIEYNPKYSQADISNFLEFKKIEQLKQQI